MASIQVFPPGYRLTDSAGKPLSGGYVEFYEAQTSAPKVVYSDSALSSSLGSTVHLGSSGFPVANQGSSTTVSVYTGEDPYKIQVYDADDVLVWSADNLQGAPALEPAEQIAPFVSVTTTGSPVTVSADDRGTLLNCTGNTVTFPSAVSLGDGFWCYVKNAASAGTGRVELSIASGLSYQGTSVTTLYLEPGQCLGIVCDGTAYRVFSDAVIYTPARFRPNTPGIIVIADRITAEPSTSIGTSYIVSTGYGSFSTHDIVTEVASGVFVGTTPPTDCGWVAYVQDENAYYAFIASAWMPVGINVEGLSQDTNPHGDNDFVATYDASASGHKKVTLGLLPGSVIAIIEDRKPQNTAAQSLTGSTDNVRELTTLAYNRGSLVSLSSNRFTLPAGTWEIEWWAPTSTANAIGKHQSFLYNQSDTAEVARGTVGGIDLGDTDTDGDMPASHGSAVVTITGSKAFEIRHRPENTVGGGYTGNFGAEVYTRVVVRRA